MRSVLITGASSDIGLALTKRYLDAGWSVIGHYRTVRPELDALRGPALATWRCDFADIGALEADLQARADELRSVDAFVSLAGEAVTGTLADAHAADYLRAFTVNTLPGLMLMGLIGPAMAARGFGRILHGGSIGVTFGGAKARVPYGLSKHAQEFIPNEARAWAARNVFVNTVRIGVTDTRLHDGMSDAERAKRAALIPAGRMATSDEIAGTLFWLGSEQNTYISGEIVNVAGGE